MMIIKKDCNSLTKYQSKYLQKVKEYFLYEYKKPKGKFRFSVETYCLFEEDSNEIASKYGVPVFFNNTQAFLHYNKRLFFSKDVWYFLFDLRWDDYDNTIAGFIGRIDVLLKGFFNERNSSVF